MSRRVDRLESAFENIDPQKVERGLLKVLQVVCVVSAIWALFFFAANPTTLLFVKAGLWIGAMHEILQIATNRLKMLDSQIVGLKVKFLDCFADTALRDQLLKNTLSNRILKELNRTK